MEVRWFALGAALIPTYCVHAGAWAAAGALLARRPQLSPAARHSILKWALFGPLITSGLALALPGWRWPLQPLRAPGAVLPSVIAAWTQVTGEAESGLRAPQSWCALLLVCWAVAFASGLLRLASSGVRLWRRLQARQPLEAGRVHERLQALLSRSALGRVCLSESREIAVPFAIGTREVCVPVGSLQALGDAELDAVLAHELAHLERRDALWFPAIAAVQALLWLQPFNRWLCWQVRHSAELACDDRAIELTGDPLGLARALTRIAEHAGSRSWGLAPSAGRSASSLLERVRRLATARVRAPAGRSTGRSAALAMLGFALCVVRLELAQASPAPLAVAPEPTPLAGLASADDLDATPGGEQFCRQLNDLLQAEQRLQQQLQSAAGSGQPDRVAALRGELDEARARRAWAEERYARWMGGAR